MAEAVEEGVGERRSLKLRGSATETTRRTSAMPRTTSLKTSRRVIEAPRRRKLSSGDWLCGEDMESLQARPMGRSALFELHPNAGTKATASERSRKIYGTGTEPGRGLATGVSTFKTEVTKSLSVMPRWPTTRCLSVV